MCITHILLPYYSQKNWWFMNPCLIICRIFAARHVPLTPFQVDLMLYQCGTLMVLVLGSQEDMIVTSI